MDTIVLNTSSLNMSEEDFFYFCQDNKYLDLERSSEGLIVVREPAGSETDLKNTELLVQLWMWNEKYEAGYVFGSSAGFTLPNSAVRSPDASWILKDRYDALDEKDVKKFAHICPDFVIELMSESDSLKTLKFKMQEWISNGCRLGWLINRKAEQVYIYRPDQAVEILQGFDQSLTGEEVLPRFVLNLKRLR